MAINDINECAKIFDKALLASQLVLILFYPPGIPPIASNLSTAVNLTTTDWELLAKAIVSVPVIKRKKVFEIAQAESVLHGYDNKQDLQDYWEKVADAYA